MKPDTNRWLWIIVFAATWVIAIGMPWQQLPVMECPFKSILRIPCPTCGGIRAILALRDFHILKALAMNPLITVGLFGVGIWGGLLLIFPQFPTPDHFKRPIRYTAIGSAVISVVYLLVVGV